MYFLVFIFKKIGPVLFVVMIQGERFSLLVFLACQGQFYDMVQYGNFRCSMCSVLSAAVLHC